MKLPETKTKIYAAIDHSVLPAHLSDQLKLNWSLRRNLQISRPGYIMRLNKIAALLNEYIETEKSKIKK